MLIAPEGAHGAPDGSAALREVLTELRADDVAHCLRNGRAGLAVEPGADVDVLIRRRSRRAVARTLARHGWRRLRAPGHRGHAFWLHLDGRTGDWTKVDLVWRLRYGDQRESTRGWLSRRRLHDGLWVASEADEQRHREHRVAGRRDTPGTVDHLLRRVPPRPTRSGPVVAVLGPDGAGKGTVVEALSARLPVAVATVYLGVRRPAGSSSTRATVAARPPSTTSTPLVRPREIAFLGRKWLRTLPLFARAYRRAWRGQVVLLDRHPLDAVAVQPARSRWGARLERTLATRLSPRPDAVVVLDAPGAVLFARKGEHSAEVLERWRRGYRSLPGPDVHVIDATRPPDEVVGQASRVVWQALARRRGWPS